MASKGLLRKITSRAVLATSLAVGGLTYSPETANAQSPSQLRGYGNAFRSAGRLYQSGLLPASSLDDLRFQQGMSLFSHLMADTNYSRANDQELKIIINEIRSNRKYGRQLEEVKEVDLNDIPVTFTANYWKDFDNDNKMDFKEETVGLWKDSFEINEKIIVGMHLPKVAVSAKGKKGTLKLFNPKGEEIYSCYKYFSYNGVNWVNTFDPQKLSDKNGPGTYAAALYLDGKFWEKREFKIVDNRKKDRSSEPKSNPKPTPKKPIKKNKTIIFEEDPN